MDLTVRAPQQIFVRGRGLNVELGGTIHVQGTTAHMVPRGTFTLRRGDVHSRRDDAHLHLRRYRASTAAA